MPRIAPVMSDGRAFTNYMSSGHLEQAIMRKYGISDELEYRAFLQRNGALVANDTRIIDIGRFKPGTRPMSYARR